MRNVYSIPTIRPLACGAAISVWMMGTVMERNPTPKPWMVRPATKVAKSGAKIWMKALKK